MVEMSALRLRRIAFFLTLMAGFAFGADPATVSELRRGFERPPDDARMMVRWWWFGPSVTKPELEREMRFMKEGGIGGFEVQPTYALELDDPAKGIRNLPFMSAEFLDALTFTGEKAKELGLRMDLTLGSGWPFGGPHIPVELASPRLRVQTGSLNLREGEKLIAVFGADGKQLPVDSPAAAGATYFISSQTRQTVKRPAVGAEGWVLNHYDTAALQAHFKAVGEPMLKALAKTPPYAIFSDSLEVYNSDWTGDFLAEFQKRRGYDLTPYLPALAGDIGPKTRAIRHDWGQTLSELCDDRYLQPLNAWAKSHSTKFRSQTYGIPPVTLSSQRFVDLPEGEGTQWKRFSTTRWASSANHLYGRPVTSSETWTWLHSPVFRATPLDMKAEADLHFLQGVNQLVAHGWPYTPPSIPEPGWRFYAAAVFNQHNPWWIVMPDITTYLQRISWILRQGTPVADVAIYMPTHDAFAGFILGRDSVNQAMEALIGPNLVPSILDAGYNFDFTDDGAIAAKGIAHKILIVANVERIPLATYQKISEYAAKGGRVIFTKRLPSLAPGLRDESDTPKIRELSTKFQLTDEAKLADALHAAQSGRFHRTAGRRRSAPQAAVLGYLLHRQHHQSCAERHRRIPRARLTGGMVGSVHRQDIQSGNHPGPGALRIARPRVLEGSRPGHPRDERSADSPGRRERQLECEVPRCAGHSDERPEAVDRRRSAQILLRYRDLRAQRCRSGGDAAGGSAGVPKLRRRHCGGPCLGTSRAFRHAGVAGESGARSRAGVHQRKAGRRSLEGALRSGGHRPPAARR